MVQQLKYQQWEKWLFVLLCLLTVSPIWLFPNFLTADGPCHVYNAGILYDILHGNGGLYLTFYYVNNCPEPNWFTHATLVLLLHIISGALAEKVLLTGCMLLFFTGFRSLLRQLAPRNLFLSLWIFPFAWQLAMLMGFYNYMFSIGSAFAISAWFIRHKHELNVKRMAVLLLSFTLLYFMHLLGCMLATAICGLSILMDKTTGREKLRLISQMAIVTLPMLALIINYIVQNYASTNNAGMPPFGELISNLNNLNSLFGLTALDIKLSMKMSFVLQAMIVLAFISFFINRPGRNIFIPLIILLFLKGLYFFSGETTLGGSYIRPRLESLIYLFIIVAAGFAAFHKYLRTASVILAVFFSVAFTVNKFGAFSDADLFVKEMQKAGKNISNSSTVLPLNLERYLRNPDSVVINNNVLLFAHVSERAAPGKQLIYMDNYEAATGYFPLAWKADMNPFVHLAVGDGIEAEPPQVDIENYSKKCAPVNYILLWGKKKEAVESPLHPALMNQLANYELIYTSPVYEIKLYKRK